MNPDYLDVIGVSVGQQTRLVVELLKKFDDFYSQAKLLANCLDFADLEHYALTLLTEPDGSPADLKPSDIALLLRKKYKYIFVDEYQDINPVQQAILDALGTGDNIFVVGDVKQSIYAFRGAEPKIFLEHLRPASTDPREARRPLRIDLNANFRSSPGVLDFVNKLFGRIMTSSLAGIDYDESAALVSPDRTEMTDSKTPLVELHIIDKQAVDTGPDESNEDESAKPDAPDIISLRQCQAYLVAERIRQMVGADTGRAEFKIYDRDIDAFRDVRFRDIAVLMRSPAKRVNDYIKVFQLAGVPVSSDAASEFFEATEISDMLCLLKVIDNFQRDIELVAVLRSPLFSLSDTDLARIRIHSRTVAARKSFYDCILAYIADGSDEKLSERLKLIFDTLNRWRHLAKSGSLSDLIWLIYRQSGLLSFVSALPAGPLRRANLLRLHDRAIQFELFASNTAVVSLSRFVDFLEKLLKTETKWSSPEPENLNEDAVRIISVHKSKGLEFPVVFLAELDDRFNYSDLSDDFLPDADLTLGLRIFDRRSKNKVSSLAHQVIAERKYGSLLAEEMRILYVALTRASARLVLTGSLKKNRAVDVLLKSLFFEDRSFVDLQLESCDNFLEWILYGLGDCKNLHRLFQTDYEHQASADDSLFSLALYGGEDLRRFSDSFEKLRLGKKLRVEKAQPQDKSLTSRLLSQLKENLSWVYEFESLSSLPAKRTVTLITHSSDEFVRLDHSKALERRPMAFVPSASADIDVRLLGSAVHLLISRLDLSRPVTRQHAEAVMGELVQNGFIDIAVAERIDVDSIIGFFQADLGKMVFESANEVFREWPFTFSIPPSELPELAHEYRVSSDERRAAGDEIVVQGMIDMLIRTQSGLFIIDFKTDNITADRCIERAKIYHTQLALYARAAADIFGSNVLKKCLYFLKPANLIELN